MKFTSKNRCTWFDNSRLKTLQVESHRVQKVQIIPLHKDGELEYEV